ncbi:MAG: M15 family metallopeptidase, partial [Ilumatobacteraceae bacterium]
GMRSVRRNGTAFKAAPTDFQFPISVTALPVNAIGPIMGNDVSAVIGAGRVVMGARGAALNGAQVGDTLELVADDGSSKIFTIGLVADDGAVGGAEVVMSPAMADTLGVVIETRVVMWGFSSRGAVDAALDESGLTARSDTRIRRSWDAVDPDSTLGLVATKRLLGEFAYSVAADDTVSLTGDWSATYLPAGRELLVAEIPIRARCNNTIRADLVAALTEVAQRGLADAIEVANANAYGGCFNARFNRLSAALGSLSRHAWGGALDTNTVSNAQGSVPQMNCDVVRIFRKHNFAWGGNFLTPDGMHFEWVGTRRDQLQYPSKYCPNLADASMTTGAAAEGGWPSTKSVVIGAARDTLFADDGWSDNG